MADRVAGEGRIPKPARDEAAEATGGAIIDNEFGTLSQSLVDVPDWNRRVEAVADAGLEAALSALPVEWLLARALDAEGIGRLGVAMWRVDNSRTAEEWCDLIAEVDSPSLLEQEAGGER